MNLTIEPGLIQLAIAIFTAITAIMTFLTNRTAKKTQHDMSIVEKATNSMKDALVKATGEASFSAGKDAGRAEGEVKAAALAEGHADKK